MSYDIKFRRQVLKIRSRDGLSFSKVAERFGISKQSVYNWSKKIDLQKTRDKPSTKINMQALKEDIERYPDAYQYERGERLGVTQMGIWHALRRLKVTYKKNSQSPQSQSRAPRRTTQRTRSRTVPNWCRARRGHPYRLQISRHDHRRSQDPDRAVLRATGPAALSYRAPLTKFQHRTREIGTPLYEPLQPPRPRMGRGWELGRRV